MKKSISIKICAIMIALFTISNVSYAQHWLLGGNNDFFPLADGLLSTSNFMGATQTADVVLGTGSLPRLFIGGTAFANPGFVGIATTTPGWLLDVSGGDIDVYTAAMGYRINGNYVLLNRGNINDIFVGVQAGFAGAGAYTSILGNQAGYHNSSAYNVFVGYQSGYDIINGSDFNTFIGANSGRYFTGFGCTQNTFLGAYAGFGDPISGSTGVDNTYLGYATGYSTTTGYDNTCSGWDAGAAISTAYENCIYGHSAFAQNTAGNNNCMFGWASGGNPSSYSNNSAFGYMSGANLSTGGNNVILGYQACQAITTGTNNIFIGAQADALQQFLQMHLQ